VNRTVNRLINHPIKDQAFFFNRWKPPYIVEPKWDGERAVFVKTRKQTYIANRYSSIYTPSEYPQLFKPLSHLKENTIIDGELTSGENVYDLLRDRVRNKDKLKLIPFDILMLEGEDLRNLTLLERKSIMEHIGLKTEYTIAQSKEEVMEVFREAVEKGFEGVVVKADAPYTAKNSWLKIKKTETIDVIVTGIAETPHYLKTGEPESFTIAVYVNGKLTPIGKVSSGNPNLKRQIKTGDIIEVEYQEILKEADSISLRHPRILRIRKDIPPEDCNIEKLSST
jgi:bifunctional non-homologous end joining protein LigD